MKVRSSYYPGRARNSQARRRLSTPRLDDDQVAALVRERQHQDKMDALKERAAELELQIAAIQCRTAKTDDKILFLPAGRVKRLPDCPPPMEFFVNEETATLLNLFASSIVGQGHTPYLDLSHTPDSPTFLIKKFEFKPGKGVLACGRYTKLGRVLLNAGRISGVSPNTPVVHPSPGTRISKPTFASINCEISAKDAAQMKPVLASTRDNAVMGGILIDGTISAIQPYWRHASISTSQLRCEVAEK